MDRRIWLRVLGVDLAFAVEGGAFGEGVPRTLLPFVRIGGVCPEGAPCVTVVERGDEALLRFAGEELVLDRSTLARELPDILTLFVISRRPELMFLHGSAVALGGRALVFVGASTSGKSTLAAALHQAGAPLLCDDLTPVHWEEGRAFAYPTGQNLRSYTQDLSRSRGWRTGFSHLRRPQVSRSYPIGAFVLMRPESQFYETVDISPALARKRHLITMFLGADAARAAHHGKTALSLRCEGAFSCAPTIRKCTASEALRPLIKHLYTPNQGPRELLRRMTALISKADTFELQPGRLDETVALVRAHCATEAFQSTRAEAGETAALGAGTA